MGGALGKLRAKSFHGRHMDVTGTASWDSLGDAASLNGQLELNGMPLQHYLDMCCLAPESHKVVTEYLLQDLHRSDSGICQRQTAQVRTVSWNVGGLSDHRRIVGASFEDTARHEIAQLLGPVLCTDGKCDVIVIALQEVVSLTLDNVLAGAPSSSRDVERHQGWPELVVQWVNLLQWVVAHGCRTPHQEDFQYALYAQPIYMFGLLLCVFARPELIGTHLHQFSMFELPVDKHKSGVKGVVACRFSLFDRSFCFINCHLQADTIKEVKRKERHFLKRFQQLQECYKHINFLLEDQLRHTLHTHHAVFLMGDTNMRLQMPSTFKTLQSFQDHVEQELASSRWSGLEVHDQYRQVRANPDILKDISQRHKKKQWNANLLEACRRELANWQEPFADNGFCFPPTFKLKVPGPGYESKRIPAWTDRIMFRSCEVRPLIYDSIRQDEILQPSRNIADHHPVWAHFEVDCIQITKLNLFKLVKLVRSKHEPTNVASGLCDNLQRSLRFTSCVMAAAKANAERLSEDVLHCLQDSDLSKQEFERFLDLLGSVQPQCWQAVCESLGECMRMAIERGHRPAGKDFPIGSGLHGNSDLDLQFLLHHVQRIALTATEAVALEQQIPLPPPTQLMPLARRRARRASLAGSSRCESHNKRGSLSEFCL